MDSAILFLCLFTSKFREIIATQHNIRHPHGLRIRDNGGDGLDGWVIAGTLAGVFSVIVAVVGAIISFVRWSSRDVSLESHVIYYEQPLSDSAQQSYPLLASRPENHGVARPLNMSSADTTIDDTHANGDTVSPPGVQHGPTKPSPAVLGRSTWP